MFEDITWSRTLHSVATWEFYVGVMAMAVVILVLLVWLLIRRCGYKHRQIVLQGDEQGEFRVAYSAVQEQIQYMLQRQYPKLKLTGIRVKHDGEGHEYISLRMAALETAALGRIRDSVREAVRRTLIQEIGFDNAIGRVDILITECRRDKSVTPPTAPETPEESTDGPMPVVE